MNQPLSSKPERLTAEQLAYASALYEQRVEADIAWKETLAERGWEGYITIVVRTLYRAGKIVRGVGVELAGDTEAEVLAMIDRIESAK